MILHFINTNKYILVAFYFALFGVFFSSEVSSEQKHTFYLPTQAGNVFWRCEHDLCNTYLQAKNGQTLVISERSSSPSVAAVNKHLIKLFFSCGSPCNYTIFYNENNGVSRSYEFVVALDARREIVLIAENNCLVGYKIFSDAKEPLFSVKRDWSPTATLFSDILEAKFVDDGLYVKYLEGKKFNEKEEVIHDVDSKTEGQSS